MVEQENEVDVNEEVVETEEEPKLKSADVRKHPLFKQMTGQINELKTQIEMFTNKQKEVEKTLEVEKAKSSQTLEQLIAQKNEEIEALKGGHDIYIKENQLRLDAVRLGINSELIVDGIVSRFHKDQPEDMRAWFKEIVESENLLPQKTESKQSQMSTGITGRAAPRNNDVQDTLNKWRTGKLTPVEYEKFHEYLALGKIKQEDLLIK